MVEYQHKLDAIFGSLADGTRRDILKRLTHKELSISEIAALYDLTLAAISKHLQVLEKAQLVSKRRRGRQHFVSLSPPAFKGAADYLERYRQLWEDRFDRLESLLKDGE